MEPLKDNPSNFDALAEVGGQIQQEFWELQNSLVMGFEVQVALGQADWVELSRLQGDIDTALDIYGACQALEHQLTAGFIPSGFDANAGHRTDTIAADSAAQPHGQPQVYGLIPPSAISRNTPIQRLSQSQAQPYSGNVLPAPFTSETLDFGCEPGLKTSGQGFVDTSDQVERGLETHGLAGNSTTPEWSGTPIVQNRTLDQRIHQPSLSNQPYYRVDENPVVDQPRGRLAASTAKQSLPPIPPPSDRGVGQNLAEDTAKPHSSHQLPESITTGNGSSHALPKPSVAGDSSFFRPVTCVKETPTFPVAGDPMAGDNEPSLTSAPLPVKGLRDLAQWLETEQPAPLSTFSESSPTPLSTFRDAKASEPPPKTPKDTVREAGAGGENYLKVKQISAFQAPNQDQFLSFEPAASSPTATNGSLAEASHLSLGHPAGQFSWQEAASTRAIAPSQAPTTPDNEMPSLVQQSRNGWLVDGQSWSDQSTPEQDRDTVSQLKALPQIADLPSKRVSRMPHRAERPSLNPERLNLSSAESTDNSGSPALQPAMSPAPEPDRWVSSPNGPLNLNLPEPMTATPAAPLPDMEDVLDAIAQEVSREYRQFYGD